MEEKKVSDDDIQKNILNALNRISKRLDGLEARLTRLEAGRPVPEAPRIDEPVTPIPQTLEPKALREARQAEEPPVKAVPAAPKAPDAREEKPAPKKKPKVKAADIESRLGVIVLTLGVILVATAMVIFASFLYQYIGAWGKAIIAYAVSSVFVIGGLLIERKVKLFGQALFALGLGLVYFVSFAIYFIEPIQVLFNKPVEIVLLSLVVAAIIFIADRKKSQFIAGMAVFLGYYTIIVSDVTLYTLLATLFLAVGALIFLIKNRWVTLPWIALVGSYATYIIWVAFKDTGEPSVVKFWISAGFLIAYFVVFALAVLILKGDKLGKTGRLIYSIINAWLFYPLMLYMYLKLTPDYKGWVECGVALVFIILAVAHALRSKDDWLFAPYVLSGLALAPIGISYAVPVQWAAPVILVLTIAVFAAGYFFKHRWLYSALQYVFVFLFGWSIYSLHMVDKSALGNWRDWVYLGSATLGIISLLVIPLIHRKTFKTAEGSIWDKFEKYSPGFGIVLGSLVLYMWPFALFGDNNASFVVVLCSLILVLFGRLGKFVAAEIMGFFALMGGVVFYFALSGATPDISGPWLHSLPAVKTWVIGLEVAVIAFVIERLLTEKYRGKYYDAASQVITATAVLFLVIFLPVYIAREFFHDYVTLAWLAIGVGFFVYGMLSRLHAYRWGSFVLLLLVPMRLFISDIPVEGMRESLVGLLVCSVSVIALFAIPVIHRRLFKPDDNKIIEKIEKYVPGAFIGGGWVATFALYLGPVQEFISVTTALVPLTVSSAWLVFYSRTGKFISADIIALLNGVFAAIFYFLTYYSRATIYDAVPLLPVPAAQIWVFGLAVAVVFFLAERVLTSRYKGAANGVISTILTITTVLFLIIYLPIYLSYEFYGNLITLSWAITGLALFAFGLVSKLRAYRLGGLALLLASVVRLFIVDLADTPILLRVAAFFITGLVLLAVAFIYIFNRERMKNWL